jgi:WhiB family transcriptional regulator, redox-sensing transcriptional regulator
MYRLGPAAVMDDSAAAEAEFGRVTAMSRSVPVTVVVKPAIPVRSVGSADVGPVGPVGVIKGGSLPCTDEPDLFFAESPVDVELAKSLCGGCQARAACLAGAMERREPWGVWGGELFIRGAIVPRKRARGRPRKDEVAA